MTAEEIPGGNQAHSQEGDGEAPRVGSSLDGHVNGRVDLIPRITVPAVIITEPVIRPPMIMETVVSNRARGAAWGRARSCGRRWRG